MRRTGIEIDSWVVLPFGDITNEPQQFARSRVFAALSLTPASAQQGTPASGEWRVNGGDTGSTRYSPLDQINAANVKNLQVVWRWKAQNMGPAPQGAWEVTPLMVGGKLFFTAGTGRTVVAADAATGETLWTYRGDDTAERGAVRPNNRGVSYWSDGKGDDRILFVTPGYQLVALNAKTGLPIANFGVDAHVDLWKGLDRPVVQKGTIGATSPPIIVRDVAVVGAALKVGVALPTKLNTPGYIRGFDVRTGKLLWTFHTVPQAGEQGTETWLQRSADRRGFLEIHRQYRRVGTVDRRRRTRLRLYSRRSAQRRYLRRPAPRRESVLRQRGLSRREDRQAHLVLPAHPSRTLGLRYSRRADPARYHRGREEDQGAGAGEQVGVYLCLRPHQRQAGVADRREARCRRAMRPANGIRRRSRSRRSPRHSTARASPKRISPTTRPEIKAEALKVASQYVLGPIYTPPIVKDTGGKLGDDPIAGRGRRRQLDGRLGRPRDRNALRPFDHGSVLSSLQPGGTRSEMQYIAAGGLGGANVMGLPLIKGPYGRITAINLNTGDHAWMIPNGKAAGQLVNNPALKAAGIDASNWGGGQRSPILITKTLLFEGSDNLRAIDKKTGAIIDEMPLGANLTGGTMTYSINGRQFIVAVVGGHRAAERNWSGWRCRCPARAAGRGGRGGRGGPPEANQD